MQSRRAKTPLAALRDRLDREPEAVAEGIARLLEKGDPRALGLLERLYADSAAHVDVPRTLDQLQQLPRDQRRALLAQLEREHGPTLTECPHCGGPLLASCVPDAGEGASHQG